MKGSEVLLKRLGQGLANMPLLVLLLAGMQPSESCMGNAAAADGAVLSSREEAPAAAPLDGNVQPAAAAEAAAAAAAAAF
jgi:hypothetical protein